MFLKMSVDEWMRKNVSESISETDDNTIRQNLKYLSNFIDIDCLSKDFWVVPDDVNHEATLSFLSSRELSGMMEDKAVTIEEMEKKFGCKVPQTLIDYKPLTEQRKVLSEKGWFKEISSAYNKLIMEHAEYVRKPSIFSKIIVGICNFILRPLKVKLFFRRVYSGWDVYSENDLREVSPDGKRLFDKEEATKEIDKKYR